MTDDNENYCYYSDLPSPLAYEDVPESAATTVLTALDIDRIIEMAWEDRTPFDAIKYQFGLTESEVRKLMKEQLRFRSYKAWRMRVEACQTKHRKIRVEEINRFRCSRQRTITQNKISKR
jgi:uncharacterized protein (TIGR03643 family)